tara:strand:+ start:2743 stop:2997 length:255 start_codon:yes stop_codon:yes gene_type:complete
MLSIDNAKWNKIDKETETTKIGKYRFIRPVNSKTISLDCPACKKLLNNVDDIESVKNNDVCEECFLIYYYQNKEKWEKGWRPYK